MSSTLFSRHCTATSPTVVDVADIVAEHQSPLLLSDILPIWENTRVAEHKSPFLLLDGYSPILPRAQQRMPRMYISLELCCSHRLPISGRGQPFDEATENPKPCSAWPRMQRRRGGLWPTPQMHPAQPADMPGGVYRIYPAPSSATRIGSSWCGERTS